LILLKSFKRRLMRDHLILLMIMEVNMI
jgi:hypothetical protein